MWKCFKDWLCSGFCKKKTSASRIIYKLPDPSHYVKLYYVGKAFQKNTKGIPEMDWSDWESVVDGFRARIYGWYFKPLSVFPVTSNEAYPVIVAMCALVDLLTQYEYNLSWHSSKKYKHFLRMKMPIFNTPLSQSFKASFREGESWTTRDLKDYAGVFYHGIRCSLHHHADLDAYAGISDLSGKGTMIYEIPNAGESVCRTYKYSLVIVDPWQLRNQMEIIFNEYCYKLQKDPHSQEARYFRERFKEDFGIPIP